MSNGVLGPSAKSVIPLSMPAFNPYPSVQLTACSRPFSWPESPVVVDGKLLVAAFGENAICEVKRDGKLEPVFQLDGSGPAAVGVMPDGRLMITCYDMHKVAIFDPRTKKTSFINTPQSPAQGLKGPNDLVLHKGGVYVTFSGDFLEDAPKQGKIVHINQHGVAKVVAGDGRGSGGDYDVRTPIDYANGICVIPEVENPGGYRLIVAEHRENRLLSYRIKADGSLTDRLPFADFDQVDDTQKRDPRREWSYGIDGIRADARGNIYCANYAGRRVRVVNASGAHLGDIAVPPKYPYVTNVWVGPDVFGGEPGPFVYVTALESDQKSDRAGGLHFPGVVLKGALTGPNGERGALAWRR